MYNYEKENVKQQIINSLISKERVAIYCRVSTHTLKSEKKFKK